jgi:hypothetical protein
MPTVNDPFQFWTGVACLCLFFLIWIIVDGFKKPQTTDEPDIYFEINRRIICDHEAARRYYVNYFRTTAGPGMMVNIYDCKTQKLLKSVRCSEYFKLKNNGPTK